MQGQNPNQLPKEQLLPVPRPHLLRKNTSEGG
jgi:hypothetical protein